CNEACNGCTGPGADQCSRCAPGFYSSQGVCFGCPSGTFGESCNGTCHCLEVSACRQSDGFCANPSTCEWGWSQPPYCQVLLPRLRVHPDISENICGNVTVSWNKWVKDEDIGVGPIGRYILQTFKINGTDQWTERQIRSDVNTSRFNAFLSGFDPLGSYIFRVNVKRIEDDKVSSEWTPGISTETVTMPCIDPTTTTIEPPTPAPTPPPGSLFQRFDVQGSGTNQITIIWEKKDYGDVLGNVTITLAKIAIGDCEVLASPIIQSTEVPGTGNLTLNLEPNGNYTITLVLDTLLHNASESDKTISRTFSTAETVPAAPTIQTVVPNVTWIEVFYEAPSPTNGVIREYEVAFSLQANFGEYTHKSTNQTSIIITERRAYTTYYVRVRARTLPGAFGQYSNVERIRTLEDYPDPPRNVNVQAVNESSLRVTWMAPLEVKGVVNGYRVKYSHVDGTTTDSVDINSASTMEYTISGLEPWTQYVVEVSASTSRGFGQSGPMVIQRTFQAVPSKPPPPVYKNHTETTILIEISPVKLPSGPVSKYVIYVNDITPTTTPGRKRRQTKNTPPGTAVAEFSDADIRTPILFLVGSGQTDGSYTNDPLIKDHTYDIYVQIISTVSGISKSNFSKIDVPVLTSVSIDVPSTTKSSIIMAPADDSSNNTVIIILIVIIIIIILIIILVVILVIWYRRRGRFKPPPYQLHENELKPTPFMVDDYNPEKYWNTISSTRESRYIVAGRELIPDDSFNTDGQNTDKHGLGIPISFQQEFHELPHEPQTTWNEALRSRNASKNRFRHLLPYDHSRVILDPDENSDSDYINACFVHGYNKRHAYIAAQSPFDEDTVLDFWRMIYQYNVKVVVMITNIIEDKIVKCTQYWPEQEEEKVRYGAFTLKLIEHQEYSDYVIRTIRIKVKHDTGPPKVVHLFEFCSWPDHGVPDDAIPLLEFRHKVRLYHGTDQSPLVVHCGTGVSRTGTYIAIDSLLEQYENEGMISVFAFIRRMRKDRIAMVRTAKQYVFIYEAIFEARVAGDTRAGFDLKQKYHTLTMRNRKTKHSFLKDQFLSLQRYTRRIHPGMCSDAMSPVNCNKNRFPDVVPPNKYRPILRTPGGLDRTDYINAVSLDSHLVRDHFILTQTPLHTTIIDFWKLVFDHDVSTIVMMEDFRNEDDTCAEYWPENKIKKFEPFFVDNTNIWQQENVTIRHFKIHNMLHPKDTPREVRQFQFNAWNDTDFIPKSKSMFLDLVDLVRSWQEQSCEDLSPVIVHCKDGATHSGLFCAVWNICEAMRADSDVDVYHTVKHMKRRRNQIVDTLDQYRFCYKALWDCMNLRMPGGTLTNMMNHTQQDRLYNVGSLSLASYASHLDYV
ncbi:hypothetical protein FSP39_016552, partial [Pinctada imbricata]